MTAYEMRISDWSSDVCSADLDAGFRRAFEDIAILRLRHTGERAAIEGCDGRSARAGILPLNIAQTSRREQFGDVGRADRMVVAGPEADVARRRIVEFGLVGRRAIAGFRAVEAVVRIIRSEEHTSELPSLMRISYAVFC